MDEKPIVQTGLCAVHKNEIIKLYCKEHDCTGCTDCIVLEHRSCNVQLVSDVSGDYGNSAEFIRIKHNIDHLKKNVAACKGEIEYSLEAAEEMKKKVVAEIKTFRKELSSYLDQIENNILTEIERLNAMDISQQKELQGQCESLENEIVEFQDRLDQCSENANQLFVASKLVHQRLQKWYEINVDTASKSQINTYEFEPAKCFKTLQMDQAPLVTLTTKIQKFTGPSKKSITEMEAHFVRKMKAKALFEGSCWITGLAMLSCDEVLLADNKRRSVKILNVSKGYVTSRYQPSSKPWDVTVIDSETAATTLGSEGKILFLNTKNGLSENRSLDVKKWCSGIDCHNDILAVTFIKPPAVQVLDFKGQVLHEVRDTSIFKQPSYISWSHNGKIMFVSEYYNNSVHELTTDAHLNATTKFETLSYPEGLTVTKDGVVLVCCPDNGDRVSMVVPGTTKIIQPQYVRNVQVPRSLLVCEEHSKLYICEHERSKNSNYIKIFDLR